MPQARTARPIAGPTLPARTAPPSRPAGRPVRTRPGRTRRCPHAMRARRLTTPSDAPCPDIGGRVLPARDRIIAGAGWARVLLIRLRRRGAGLRRAKQAESGLAGLRTILSIRGVAGHR